MSWYQIYFAGGGIILACLFFVWLCSLVLRNSGIMDVFWGLGFVILAWFYAYWGEGFWARKYLMIALVTVWGLRLSLYILYRSWGEEEDPRYRKWREEAGASWWWRSFFKVFLLQGVIIWLISTPLLAAELQATPETFTRFDMIGIIIWIVGFFFESVGDYQLMKFKANPENKGKLLTTGLWRYTRHPNYFGDATLWWGYFFIALSVPYGHYTFYAPLLMTILLVKVSGVAMTEKHMKETKPGYEEYIERTSTFMPWPPKKVE